MLLNVSGSFYSSGRVHLAVESPIRAGRGLVVSDRAPLDIIVNTNPGNGLEVSQVPFFITLPREMGPFA